MKKVLIKPLWPNGLGGKLFETCYPWSFQKWKAAAADLGILLEGWDMAPLETADCVWCLDLPATKREFYEAKEKARPGTPFVLQVMETPTCRKNLFVEDNRKYFDFIVTYEHQAPDSPDNYFHYRLPHSLGGFSGRDLPFSQRRCALMVGANKYVGFLAPRSAANNHVPGWGLHLGGWKVPGRAWLWPAHGELISWRRALAREGRNMPSGILDIVGSGWGGERISWFRWLPKEHYPNRLSAHIPDKLAVAAGYRFLIASENFRGNVGYISEKLFDAFVAGTVPVYLGDERIQEIVPAEAFVDARRFKSQRLLLEYLAACPESEWQAMRDAGSEFLDSGRAREFSTDSFVDTMNSILLRILLDDLHEIQ